MDVTVTTPRGYDTAIVLESIDDRVHGIRNYRGARIAPGREAVIAAGSLLILHSQGNRYWPGVITLCQVAADGSLSPVIDAAGAIGASGSGRARNLAPRVNRILTELASARLAAHEQVLVEGLQHMTPERARLIVQLAHGDGWRNTEESEDAPAFDPEIAA